MDKTTTIKLYENWIKTFKSLPDGELSIAEHCLNEESKSRRIRKMKKIYEGLR